MLTKPPEGRVTGLVDGEAQGQSVLDLLPEAIRKDVEVWIELQLNHTDDEVAVQDEVEAVEMAEQVVDLGLRQVGDR